MRRRFRCHGAEGQRHRAAMSGPYCRVGSGEAASDGKSVPGFQQIRSWAKSRCCGATSRGRDDVTEPHALQWRQFDTYSGVREVGQDQQRRKAYRVIGLLRGPRPQGRRRRGSGVAVSAYTVVGFVALWG
ncbi:hypothetical protein NDU88_002340 [Pleurodeles waltl]|uniref:Uncharacterized protein n=1 Tax=Pleurodeles waltl TaxID=8319 RepID=A0AAV7SBN1_PLEWA|nr:hypothetical protein NDU88_002340 [Pleurodeles waltl]